MDAFTALADPIRADIVRMLSQRDLTAGAIAARYPVSRPAVSRHLSVLLRSGLVQVRGEAQRRVYSLDPTGLDDVERWVEACRREWNKRLDDLGAHLDAKAAQRKERADDA